MTPQLLLAGLLCALALNAITAWIRLARAPGVPRLPTRAIPWWTLSAALQTLALLAVFLLVALYPQAFGGMLASGPYATLVLTIAVPVLVILMLWRLIVELTRTLPVLRRQRAEAALGRRVLSIARRRRVPLP